MTIEEQREDQLEQMSKPELIELAKLQSKTLETQTRSLDLIIRKSAIAFTIWGILQIVLFFLTARKR